MQLTISLQERNMKRLIFTALIFSLSSPLLGFAQTYKYEPAIVTLQGRLLLASGQTPDGKKINFPALQLPKPVTIQGDQESPTEKGVILMHMVIEPKMMNTFNSLKGKSVSVTGTMFHSDNGNHQTNVLITPTTLTPTK
jgi:hypothetical protein